MTLRTRLTDEAGMTLVEMMIAVSLLGVVIAPISAAFFLGFLETNSTRDRIADSSSAQLVSSFFLPDVQSAQSVALGGSTCAPMGTVQLQMQWVDPKTNDATVVSYLDVTNASGQHELHRATCLNGGPANTTLLVQHLASSGFTAACTPSCAAPATVKATVKAKSQSPQEESSYSPLEFSLEAMRRVTP